ncbi:hypothetical protein [Rubrimonas cliftonensis]|uniref:2-keto-4-pentenoate hydratase n=1 Tax=Rubrimonas cliftonensis TaxID=89524 RepID=A0A1H4CXM8_9RHOB|nr:hypothetical protein [Rubrimonas cliftonensis]SEA65164.1 2-keto-4-pentenoate hydratase [Rubrimonas cliftonensis]
MSGAVPYHRRERSPLLPVLLDAQTAPRSLAEAYAAMAAQAAATPGSWTAWKLGGTNAASRAAFGVATPYFGALHRDEVLDRPAAAPGFALFELRGEVEPAVRIAPSGEGFDACCVALEMPSSPVADLPSVGVAALVADRCAAGALLLGPASPPAAMAALEAGRLTLEIDGAAAGEGGLDALVASPAACLADFLALARGLGFAPRPGDWVALGGVTPCLDLPEGARVRVLLDDAAQLDFTVSAGPRADG